MRVFLSCCVLAATGIASADDAPRRRDWTGDALLRGDFVRDLPGGRDDLDRARARLRAGVRHTFGPRWEGRAALRAALGTEDNRDDRKNFDNEKTDGLRADRLELRWLGPAGVEIAAGKTELLPTLGPMLWDPDLRPVGAGYQQTFDVRGLDTLTAALAWAHPHHDLERGSESRLGVAQLDWRIRDGAPTSGAVTLSYVVFDELERLGPSGLVRTNALTPQAGFDLLDLQLTGRWTLGDRPLRVTLDGVVNLDAVDEDRDAGVELFVVLGQRREPGRWEGGLTTRRVQRDATVAAFNDDDWWFATRMRGTRVWAARGLGRGVWIRVAASTERRDDLDETLERLLVDIGIDF